MRGKRGKGSKGGPEWDGGEEGDVEKIRKRGNAISLRTPRQMRRG